MLNAEFLMDFLQFTLYSSDVYIQLEATANDYYSNQLF